MAIRHILTILALFSLAVPLVAAVGLGPEVPLSSAIELRAATGAQTTPSVASNGRDFVAIWLDARKGSEIRATRIGADGRPADPFGRVIAEGVTAPKIASAGSDYLAVWATPSAGVQSVRLDESGSPMTSPRTVNAGSPRALLSNGSTYLMLIDPSAVLLDRNGARLFSVVQYFFNPLGAGVRGGRYVVVDGTSPMRLRTIADDASFSDVVLPPSISGSGEATAAFSPDAILIVWSSGSYAVVGYDGTVIHQPTALPGNHGSDAHAAAGWDGHQFLISLSGRETFRVTADGLLLDLLPFVLSQGTVGELIFASNGTTQLLVWTEPRERTERDLVGRAVTDFDALAAAPAPPSILTYSAPPQREVRIAAGPTGVFGVWVEDQRTLRGALNGVPITIDASDSEVIDSPVLAAGSRVFLVVWHRTDSGANDRLLAKRFDFGGKDLDPQPLVLTARVSRPVDDPQASIAFDGSAFFAAWVTTPTLNTIRIGQEGQPFGPRETTLAFSGTQLPSHSPHAFWTGSQFFVGYKYGFYFGPHDFVGTSNIATIRFDASGTGLQEASGSLVGVAPDGMDAALSDGNVTFAFVNTPSRTIQVLQMSAGTGIATNGRLVASFTFAEEVPKSVAIGWNGAEFVLAWPQSIGNEIKLHGMRLDSKLALIDGEPFEVAAGVDKIFAPSLIRVANGVLAGYSRFDDASGSALRAFTRLIELRGQPPRRRTVRP
jgi:hypothetical protein